MHALEILPPPGILLKPVRYQDEGLGVRVKGLGWFPSVESLIEGLVLRAKLLAAYPEVDAGWVQYVRESVSLDKAWLEDLDKADSVAAVDVLAALRLMRAFVSEVNQYEVAAAASFLFNAHQMCLRGDVFVREHKGKTALTYKLSDQRSVTCVVGVERVQTCWRRGDKTEMLPDGFTSWTLLSLMLLP